MANGWLLLLMAIDKLRNIDGSQGTSAFHEERNRVSRLLLNPRARGCDLISTASLCIRFIRYIRVVVKPAVRANGFETAMNAAGGSMQIEALLPVRQDTRLVGQGVGRGPIIFLKPDRRESIAGGSRLFDAWGPGCISLKKRREPPRGEDSRCQFSRALASLGSDDSGSKAHFSLVIQSARAAVRRKEFVPFLGLQPGRFEDLDRARRGGIRTVERSNRPGGSPCWLDRDRGEPAKTSGRPDPVEPERLPGLRQVIPTRVDRAIWISALCRVSLTLSHDSTRSRFFNP